MNSVFWIGTISMFTMVLGLLFLAVFYQRSLTKFKIKEAELLLKNSLDSEKHERKRIAADLHDGLQGDLIAVKNFIFLLERAKNEDEKQELLTDTKTAVTNAIENTRLLSQKLMPPLLADRGLEEALNHYFATLNKSTGKTFTLESSTLNDALSKDISYELFRIVQEFCSNFLKYGNGNQMTVSINQADNFYTLELRDDGIPFDFKVCYTQSSGNGLKNIQSRINVLKGKLFQLPMKNGNHFHIQLND